MEPALGLQPWERVLIFSLFELHRSAGSISCRLTVLLCFSSLGNPVRRVFPPAGSAFRCPAFVPGRFSCASNWAFPAAHPCLFLVLDHGRILFLCDPRVALWSHSAAELLLMLLAVAGFRMGEL